MTKFWFYICTLVLVLYMFLIVGHAKILHVSVLSHCCNVEKTRATYRHEESMKKLLRECDRELDDPKKSDPGVITACMVECIANKLKLLNENNTINDVAFRDYIAHEVATQDYQKAIAKEAAMKCFEITKGLVDVDSFGCSTIPIRLLHCITREFFHSCPIELQDQSERCVDMRKYVTRD